MFIKVDEPECLASSYRYLPTYLPTYLGTYNRDRKTWKNVSLKIVPIRRNIWRGSGAGIQKFCRGFESIILSEFGICWERTWRRRKMFFFLSLYVGTYLVMTQFCDCFYIFQKNWAIPDLLYFYCHFCNTVGSRYKKWPITGFKLRTSDVGSNHSTNWATINSL